MNDLAASGMTMIVVTHEMGFARNVSNNVAFMDGGKLIEHGPSARVLTQPDNPRTADFLKAVQR
ncbi:Histidine transport ATP-binding protein HisP [compost metagenome]